MFERVFKEFNYPNELVFFGDSVDALAYLTKTDIEPFIIFSDTKMPKLDGMELREKIHCNEDLRLKCIPYLFFTSTTEQDYVIAAYSKSAQGFFIKPSELAKLRKVLKMIIDYWLECESPNYIK